MRPDTIIRKSSSWEGLFQRLTLILSLVFLTLPSIAVADVTGKPRVVDGDTIWIGETKIRLHGIDAPEMKQTCIKGDEKYSCGQAATVALKEMLTDRDVKCQGKDVDRYGRIVAVCFVGEVDINASMVVLGWALAYRRYSMDYVDEEATAKASRVGMWAGEFVEPWEWRRK